MKGRILILSAFAVTWIFACSSDSTIRAGVDDDSGNANDNASVMFAFSDRDFAGYSVRVCGSRPAPDPKYSCNSSLTLDVEAGTDAGDACPCFTFNDDGSLADSTGAPAAATGLCPSIDVPTANWTFQYEIFDTPDCTGTLLNDRTSDLACFDSHDIATRAFRNQSVRPLQPGLNTNQILCATPETPVLSQGACSTASSQSLILRDGNVVAYIPHARWGAGSPGATDVSVINVEGSAIPAPVRIPTTQRVTSCASNSTTGRTVCIGGNSASVYLFDGTTLTGTLTSGTTGYYARADGGTKSYCQNCNVTMDPVHNRALIGMSVDAAGNGGYQFLDLATNAFSQLIPSRTANHEISDGPLIDPIHNRILAPVQTAKSWEIIDVTDPANPAYFLRNVNLPQAAFDAVAMECETGIAVVAAGSGAGAANVYLADLTQATYTPGAPFGSWSGAAQAQVLTGAIVGNAEFLAIAQGTHLGVVGNENTDYVVAIELPSTSGTGTPAVTDYMICQVATGFTVGSDPQPIAAYKSPSNDHAMATIVNNAATRLAVVDLTLMLDPNIVPRNTYGQACAAGTLPSSVVRILTIP